LSFKERQQQFQKLLLEAQSRTLTNEDLKALNINCDEAPWTDLRRFQVYSKAYFLRIYKSLKEDFLLVFDHLGEKEFKRLVKSFIQETPSTFTSLAQISTSFASQLQLKFPQSLIAEQAKLEILKILMEYTSERDMSPRQEFWSSQRYTFLKTSYDLYHQKNLCTKIYIVYADRENETHSQEVTEKEMQFLMAAQQSSSILDLVEQVSSISAEDLQYWSKKWSEASLLMIHQVSH